MLPNTHLVIPPGATDLRTVSTPLRTAKPKPNPIGPTGMPMDTEGMLGIAQAAAQKLQYMNQYRQQRQGENRDFATQSENLNIQHPLDQNQLNNNYGGRGLGFSSAYGHANAQLGDIYNRTLGDLIESHQTNLNNLLQNKRAYMDAYGLNQAAIRMAAAERLSQMAGSLGLAEPTTDADRIAQLLRGAR